METPAPCSLILSAVLRSGLLDSPSLDSAHTSVMSISINVLLCSRIIFASSLPLLLCLLLRLVLFLWLHFCVLHSTLANWGNSGNWAGNWHISLACWSWSCPSGRGDSSKQKLFSGILLMRRLRPQRRRLRCRCCCRSRSLVCSTCSAYRVHFIYGFTLG